MKKVIAAFTALFTLCIFPLGVLLPSVSAVGCGSGACQQSPCMPGMPLLQGTCKCVPTSDGGPSLDADEKD
jgi:hypothetical protein